jgi:hypothetical protein
MFPLNLLESALPSPAARWIMKSDRSLHENECIGPLHSERRYVPVNAGWSRRIHSHVFFCHFLCTSGDTTIPLMVLQGCGISKDFSYSTCNQILESRYRIQGPSSYGRFRTVWDHFSFGPAGEADGQTPGGVLLFPFGIEPEHITTCKGRFNSSVLRTEWICDGSLINQRSGINVQRSTFIAISVLVSFFNVKATFGPVGMPRLSEQWDFW